MIVDIIYLKYITIPILKLNDLSCITPTDIDGTLFIGVYYPTHWYGVNRVH